MTMLLNPLLDALEAARKAGASAIHPDDEVTVEENGGEWIFEFRPRKDTLGGGMRITVAKLDSRVVKVVRGQ